MSTMWGLFTLAAARASRKKRSMTTVDAASSAASTLMAMRLFSERWTASYTAAMPPRPISRVTLYLPRRTAPTGIFDSFWMAAIAGAWGTPGPGPRLPPLAAGSRESTTPGRHDAAPSTARPTARAPDRLEPKVADRDEETRERLGGNGGGGAGGGRQPRQR